MKVILLEDIKGVGKKGQTINASDGHARNFLLPKGLAIEANKKNMNELDLKKKSEENKKQKELEKNQALKALIETKEVCLNVKTGENGKLFGSVTNKEVAQALMDQHDIAIDKKKITLKESIKSVGEYIAEIKLHPKVMATLKIAIKEN